MKKVRRWEEHWLFIKKYLTKGTSIASFAPSSQTLAEKLCRFVDPKKPQTILELGAGTGAVTRMIEKKMHPNSILIAVEQDGDFVNYLQNSCKKARIIHGNAQTMLASIHSMGINSVDVIINGLPTPSLPKKIIKIIYENCQSLIVGEVPISQLTIMPWVYFKMYKKYFEKVEFDFVFKSIPPGGIYHCWKLKSFS